MSAIARHPASPEPPADPPALRGPLRVLGLVSLGLGAVAAAVAFVTPLRSPAATAALAALAIAAVALAALVQAGARRTGRRTSGPATAGFMLGVAALGILAVSFVPAALGLGLSA
ncbi:hypothetical protein ACFPER_02570 [Agromyces aurantiacus]|uniref:DUF4190 domain-containing protein n=1 Tax=Agromyces aurantiacus TaxID=165814 RepID=A0ABV9R230_9MICO|nr:hypothetical protein [Agromyces aurantiacus]MBM7505972.1 low temperature requirement protein LtrA [Agromyces aurantiacus]